MTRLSLVVPLFAAVTLLATPSAGRPDAAPAAPPGKVQVKLDGQTFTLPAGFTIERVTTTSLTKRPVAAAFDDEGRLYVTEASGTNDPVKKQLVDKPHTLLRLVDTDGDGKFDSSAAFADKLMLPEGVMFLGGSVYVGNPPVITKFTDTNHDGKADKRETWFDGKTLTGCANDLHGPYAGPDGWVYWTKGAFARQEYTLPNGKKFSTRASHIFRARPDGTGVEPVMTGGMDNPVDVAFTPGGERIFTTTFLQRPANGRRDGLIHAVYGGVYGKDHDPIYEHPWTSPDLMPVLVHLGAAAPCGLHRYESDQFGPGYTNNLFACCFNLHKVTRHVLIPDGSTFRTRDDDFLVSDSLDFHPTDVIEDADGSLLVVNTGGWYKLCCPTSQLVKPDVFGAIYRIKKTGSHKVEDPWGKKIDFKKMDLITALQNGPMRFLDDPRPVVRRRAIEANAAMWNEAIHSAYDTKASALARLNGVWSFCRMSFPAARKETRAALADPDKTVRQAAIHAVSVWRDKEAVPELIKLLKNPSLHNRRAAAEALGRMGDETAVPALFDALADDKMDRVLEHSLTYALIEIGDRTQTSFGLKSKSPRVRRAAMIALDQMPGGKLEVSTITQALKSGDAETQRAAIWIAGRRPDVGAALVEFYQPQFRKAYSMDSDQVAALVAQVASLATNPAIQKFLADQLVSERTTKQAGLACLKVMVRSQVKTTPAGWLTGIARWLQSPVTDEIRTALATLRSLPVPKSAPKELITALLSLSASTKQPDDIRLAALAAIPGGLPKVDDATFAFLLGRLDKSRPVAERAAATDTLAAANLSAAQLTQLTAALPKAGPMEVGKLVPAFAKSRDEAVGRALAAVLATPAVRSMIRREQVKPVFDKYPPAVRAEADKLYAKLDADTAGQRAKLEALLAQVKDGDVRRGQAVFHSTKAACISCHAMGYLGGKVGPDLTHVGRIRSERDLLEAIVFPSASFVRSFEPAKIVTLDGKVFNGILKSDAADEVVLVLSATEQVRVPRKDIDEMTPGTVSVMPNGLDQQLSRRELADLIAFLRASK
jgi:putative membrane-bound dehydrogenase-like protein